MTSPTPSQSLGSLFPDCPPKQAEILEAALELFVTHGFHAATIPAIARRAGLATGTIYLYFQSKEQLVNALLAEIRGRLARELTGSVAGVRGIRPQFEAIWQVFARLALHHERALAFCDLHHHASYLTEATQAAWRPGVAVLEAHFAAGRREGIYRDLPTPVLRALLAGVLLGLHKVSRSEGFPLTAELLDEGREAAWRAVTADKRGRR